VSGLEIQINDDIKICTEVYNHLNSRQAFFAKFMHHRPVFWVGAGRDIKANAEKGDLEESNRYLRSVGADVEHALVDLLIKFKLGQFDRPLRHIRSIYRID
jgi:hypothetical protein